MGVTAMVEGGEGRRERFALSERWMCRCSGARCKGELEVGEIRWRLSGGRMAGGLVFNGTGKERTAEGQRGQISALFNWEPI